MNKIVLKSIIYKSDAGRQRLESHYQTFLTKLGSGVSIKRNKTRFGEGQLLVLGPSDGTPIICLHAMRTGAPFLLSELIPLSKVAKLYVPDLLGQSIKGIDTKLSLKDNSYADWLVDVMNHEGLASAGVFGVSWGGWVARLMANAYDERVSHLAMMVPAWDCKRLSFSKFVTNGRPLNSIQALTDTKKFGISIGSAIDYNRR